MQYFKQLPIINKEYHFLAFVEKQRKHLSNSEENPVKVGKAYTGKKADSPGKFWERNFIFLVGFIFMICLANLITTGILIYFFLETLH